MSDKTPANPNPADETGPLAGQRPPTPADPPPAATPADPPPAAAYAGPPPAAAYDVDGGTLPAQRSWRDRFRRGTASGGNPAFGLGALLAGTLAGLIVGGLGGAAIGAVVGDDGHGPGGREGWAEQGFPGGDLDHGRGGPPHGLAPAPGPQGIPPVPDDDGDLDGSSSS